MARRIRSNKPISIDVTADEKPLAERSGAVSEGENNNDVNSQKAKFTNRLSDMKPPQQEDFLQDRLMCQGNTLEELKKDFENNIKTDKAINFANAELDDYINNTANNDDPSDEPDDDDDTSDEEPTSPMFEEMEDFSEDEFKSTIKGVSGFVRESFKKSIDMLNDILNRLKRVEEKSELHSEQLKKLDKRGDVRDLLKGIDGRIKSLEINGTTSSDAPSGNYSITLPNRPEPIEIEGTFPKEWSYMLQLSQARVNQLWVGPTGCGKSYLAEKMADTVGLP